MQKYLQKLLLIAAMIIAPWVTQAQVTLPYSTGFEGLSTGQLPSGWLQLVQGSSSAGTFPAAYVYASNARNGSVYFEFESTTGQTEVAALPQMSNISSLQFTFYASLMNANFLFEVGVLEDDSIFVPVDTVTLTTGTNWHNDYHPYTVYFNNYTGYGDRIAMRVTSSGSYTLMMDDFVIDYAPTCPQTSEIVFDSIGEENATFHWTEMGTATQWVLEYDTLPFTPGTGAGNLVTLTDTFYTITGMSAGQTYFIYLHADCGLGDTSANRFTYFSVGSGPATAPYMCNFEGVGDNGWNFINGNNAWVVGSATNNGGTHSMYISDNNGSSNSYNGSNLSFSYAYRDMVLGAGGYAITYDWKCYGEGYYDYMRVFLAPASLTLTANLDPSGGNSTYNWRTAALPTGCISLCGTEQLNQQSSWQNFYCDFLVPDSGDYKLVFAWANDGSVGNNPPAAVDNINLVRPTCPRPANVLYSNLTEHSFDVSWTEAGTATQWAVELKEGDSVVSVTPTTTPNISFTMLNDNTLYTVSVASVCDVDDTSLWTPISVLTYCDPIDSLPYTYGFENEYGNYSNADFGVNCWFRVTDATGSYYPYVETYADYAHTGTHSLYWYDYYYSGGSYGMNQFLVMPNVDSTEYPINTLQLRLWARAAYSYSYPVYQVGVITDLQDPTSFTPVATLNIGNNMQWQEYDVPFTNYTGPHGLVAIYVTGSSSGNTGYLDDFTLEVAPACQRPQNLHMVTMDDESITIDWDDPDTTTTAWQVICVPAGLPITSDSAMTDYPTAHPFVISSLEQGTAYDIYVYAECASGSDYSYASMITANTACTPIDTLPYRYGFEGTVASSSGTIDVCWHKGEVNGFSNYPYPSSNAFEGTRSLYFYGYYYDNQKSYAVMPMFSDSIDDLQVSFKLRAGDMASWYCNELNVGLMTNPYDINTFTPITRCEATSNTTWDSFIVLLSGHQSEGRYIAFLSQARNSSYYYNYVYLDDVVVDYAPNCGPVTNLSSLASTTSAVVSWEPSVLGESQGAVVEYRATDDTLSDWTTVSTTDNYIALVGLDPTTEYEVHVYNACVEGNSTAYTTTLFTTSGFSCVPDTSTTIADTIGNGSGSNTYIPSYSYYGNGLSQQVYLDRELAGIGKITHMKLNTSNASSMTRMWDIYLANVSDSTASNWIDPTQKTLVWSGPVTYDITSGWTEFEFTTQFDRTPGSNLLVMVSDHTGSYVSSPYNTAVTHTLPNGRQSIYLYRDGAAYNADYPSSNGSGNTVSDRCNMVFDGYPCTSEMSTCAAPPVIVTGYNPFGATLYWAPGSGESSWEVFYREASDNAWTSVGEVYTNSYTFNTLTPGTDYQAKVVNNCGVESLFSIVDFFVPCAGISSLPFYENFDSYGTGNGVHAPVCWGYGSGYDEYYPYIIGTNHGTNSGGSMYLYNSTYYDANSLTYFILPELDSSVARINEVQAVFYAYDDYNGYNHQVIVGVCSDPDNISTFVPVDTISTITGAWTLFEIPLSSYTGTGTYITIASHPGPGSSYCYPYVDDLWIERIPSCQRPDSLQVSNITATSVDLQWRSRTDASEFVIEYGPLGFTPGTGTPIVVTTNPYTLTGLPASYQGEYYVRNICEPGDTSDYSRFSCRFSLNQIPATVPYHFNFEDSTEWSNWQVNSNCGINWYRGTTVPAYDSSYSMYISPDGGVTFGTNMSAIVNSAAYRDIDFGTVSNSYDLTFRYKCGGTVSNRYDGLMVFLVDPNTPVEASNSGIVSPWGNVNELYRIANLRLDTAWTLCHSIFDTVHGVKRVAFFWFNQGTGTGDFIFGPAAVDDINISLSPCPRPVNMDTGAVITSTTAQLVWDGPTSTQYRIAYREANAPASTNLYVTSNTNSVTLTGLSPITSYVAWVQKICGTDSSLFSDGVQFSTKLCDGSVESYNYDAAMSSTTSSYGPIGYATYNYSYVQTIIDSAHMAGMTSPITAFAFNALNTTSSNYYTGMDVYMANVTESDLNSGFILPDATHQFVHVISNATFNFTDVGWQLHGFDSTFTWDGHSNVLFAVNRQHGSWYSSTSFSAHNTGTNRFRYIYQDSGPYNPNTVSGGYTLSYAGDIMFVSCPDVPDCAEPIISSVTQTYESATITWTGDGNDYEVNIKESIATSWPAPDIAVTGNTYTFTGLQPATEYTFRVRQNCTADTLGYSEWVIDGVTTDSLPCFTPDSLSVVAVTNSTATLDWVPVGTETAWEIHVWTSGGIDNIVTANSHPATVGGFTANTTYNATVRPLCGSANEVAGDWSDTINFTTAVCPDVTGLGTRNPTPSSVEVYWDPDPLAQSWIIEYGFHGFDLGTGTQVTTALSTYVVTGLMDDMEYDFRVRAVCGSDWQSEGWASTSATTLPGGITCNAPTAVSAVVAGNAATISWTPGEGNITFELEYGTRGFAHGNGTTVNATASPVTLPNLEYETNYDVYVRGICANNTPSGWSTVTSFTTEAQGADDCDPVTNLAASNVTESAALLTWTPGNTGDEWEVVLTNASGATVSETSTTEHQYQLTSLTPGTAYVAKVRTACGDGQYSTYVSTSFTTIAVGIDDVTAPACTIYPNPTSSATTISVSGISGKVRIAVVDMNGREVVAETLDCAGDCAKTMDVDKLAQGAYFVRITGENANLVKKLIVR